VHTQLTETTAAAAAHAPPSQRRARAAEAALRRVFGVYYLWCRLLNLLFPRVRDGDLRVKALPDVYRPVYRMSALADGCGPGMRVLEVGCGTGVASLAAALKGSRVVAVDISDAALRNARLNFDDHHYVDAECRWSDMYSAVPEKFDRILAHPPYVQLRMPGRDRQWATSADFVERLIEGARDHLELGGELVIQWPHAHRRDIERLAAAAGMEVTSVTPAPRSAIGERLLRLLYLSVGFRPLIYRLREVHG
jgi:methylase of polypeptide subunit release factors